MTTRKKGGSTPTQPLQKANGKKAKAIGRPTKFIPELTSKFIEFVRQGVPVTTACGACRVDFQTIQNWCDRGQKAGKGLYFDFFEQYQAARSEALIVPQLHWRRAMPDDWRAAQAWLRVRDREHYAEPDSGQVSINADRVVAVFPAHPGDKEWLKQLEQLKSSGNLNSDSKLS